MILSLVLMVIFYLLLRNEIKRKDERIIQLLELLEVYKNMDIIHKNIGIERANRMKNRLLDKHRKKI